MKDRAASHAVLQIATPKNCAVYPAFYNWIDEECGASPAFLIS